MARKTKQQARETRQLILDVALRLFSQQGVSSTSLATIAKAAGVTRGAIYWHFKNKSDLFNEIWELSDASISDLEIEYRAKFPNDPLSVIREILVYVLEATCVSSHRYCNCLRTLKEGLPDVDAAYRCRLFWVL
ncbi:TetR family transcriptional regulator, partial [Klebsiella pneumoniae]|uniref:TetR family transcriptional regulator n=1 Tax=Klebsiella pneumoniae TaxID=573 RepID=UPI001D0DD4C7